MATPNSITIIIHIWAYIRSLIDISTDLEEPLDHVQMAFRGREYEHGVPAVLPHSQELFPGHSLLNLFELIQISFLNQSEYFLHKT